MTTKRGVAVLALPLALVLGLGAPAAAQPRHHHHHNHHHHHGGLSGVQGTVFESCLLVPGAAAEQPCEGSPLLATVSAQDGSGDIVADTVSDAQGRFQLALVAGHYTLLTDPGDESLNCPDTPVTVKAGQVATASIVCFMGGRVPPP